MTIPDQLQNPVDPEIINQWLLHAELGAVTFNRGRGEETFILTNAVYKRYLGADGIEVTEPFVTLEGIHPEQGREEVPLDRYWRWVNFDPAKFIAGEDQAETPEALGSLVGSLESDFLPLDPLVQQELAAKRLAGLFAPLEDSELHSVSDDARHMAAERLSSTLNYSSELVEVVGTTGNSRDNCLGLVDRFRVDSELRFRVGSFLLDAIAKPAVLRLMPIRVGVDAEKDSTIDIINGIIKARIGGNLTSREVVALFALAMLDATISDTWEVEVVDYDAKLRPDREGQHRFAANQLLNWLSDPRS